MAFLSDPFGGTDLDLVSAAELGSELGRRVNEALGFASSIDGAHHKQWVIDQMVRALTGGGYALWVQNYESCGNFDCVRHEDGTDDWTIDCDSGYSWEEGIAP